MFVMMCQCWTGYRVCEPGSVPLNQLSYRKKGNIISWRRFISMQHLSPCCVTFFCSPLCLCVWSLNCTIFPHIRTCSPALTPHPPPPPCKQAYAGAHIHSAELSVMEQGITFLRCVTRAVMLSTLHQKQTRENVTVMSRHHIPSQTPLTKCLYVPVNIHETETAHLFEHVKKSVCTRLISAGACLLHLRNFTLCASACFHVFGVFLGFPCAIQPMCTHAHYCLAFPCSPSCPNTGLC